MAARQLKRTNWIALIAFVAGLVAAFGAHWLMHATTWWAPAIIGLVVCWSAYQGMAKHAALENAANFKTKN